ncbi:MAG: chemotaxis protein CheW [Acidimicrobiales bacterium]
MEDIDELLQEFLVESHELLDTLDESFVLLEENPSDSVVLGSIFRVMHTIKGTCGFLGFNHLEGLAHKAENLLSLLRDGSLSLTTAMTDALLATVDRIRRFLDVIEATQHDDGVEWADLDARLVALAEGRPEPEGAEETETETETETDPPLPAIESAEAGRVGDLLVGAGEASRTAVEIAAAEQQFGDQRPIGEILVGQGDVGEAELAAALDQQGSADQQGSGDQQASGRNAADSTIRVDVDLLDDLMTLVGELVLARNEVMQLVGVNPDGAFAVSAQRLNLITSELQERVMKTRMQPIGTVWGKLPRVVRDLAHQLGKQVRLEMEGKETELDKSLIEAIKDPLTHIVRNTVDHGIETPDKRRAAGKPIEGVLRLTAGHEGGQVNIEIRDDGAGIDLDRVRAKAVELGLVTVEFANAMSDAEAVQLIFMPGFSTAKQITNVSGRGVGMDVVKTNIEKIGGSVEVRTSAGQGTTFKIKIPLTLAIIPALIVGCGGRRYAIPQINLVELVKVDNDERGRGIEYLHGAPVFRLRDRLLPVVDLRGRLGGSEPDSTDCDMVVLSAEDHRFGVLVDDIYETQEIVVKPLGQVVADAPMFSGATILGDGRVALIVDVMGLAQETRILSGGSDTTALREAAAAASSGEVDAMKSLLLLSVGQGRRVAMALSDVARLEEFPAGQLEMSAYRPVVQYRGEIMPLIDLAQDLGYGRAMAGEDGAPVNVVVYHHHGRDVGLLIDEVLDIVDEQVGSTGNGGTVVVSGRVTELFDPGALPSLAALDRELQLQEAQ